jgi:hypothetical protein
MLFYAACSYFCLTSNDSVQPLVLIQSTPFLGVAFPYYSIALKISECKLLCITTIHKSDLLLKEGSYSS